MKRIFTAFMFVLLSPQFITIYTQQVTTQWVRNNFNGFPVGVMIGLDNNSNVIVTGQTGDNSQLMTSKYDSEGNLIWQKLYSVSGFGVVATWVSVDAAGNIIVTGYPRTFSSNPVQVGLLTIKYDNNGNLLWDKLISGTWAYAVRSIIDPTGNIYVTGRAWQYTATYDFVTVKYAPDGTQLWFDTFDNNGGFDTPTNMTLDQSGNLYITGGGPASGMLTVKYNSSGTRQWTKTAPGAGGHSIIAGNGGVYVTGSLYVPASGNDDVRLIKYDLNGNLVWEKFYNFGGVDYGRLLNFDSQSNVYITGHSALPNAFVGWIAVKVDAAGNLVWHQRFKVNQNWEEYPYFALVGPQNELYITGNIGVVSGGTTYHGLETIRLNSNGNTTWVAIVDQYAGIGKGLVLASDMSLYAVGMFYYSVLKYGQSGITGGIQILQGIPQEFYIEQNYPNPFNPVTKIWFDIATESVAKIVVYDISGREVETIVNGKFNPGRYEINWDGSGFSSGIYFYRLTAQGYSDTRRMILIK